MARLLALAHHFDELLKTGAVESQAELAELAKLTPARVTQIMNLLGLAPDLQEEILFLPPVTEGQPAISERDLRDVLEDACVERAAGAVGETVADALTVLVLLGGRLRRSLPPVTEGKLSVTERHLRAVLKTVAWSEQRERWAGIQQTRCIGTCCTNI